MRAATKAVRSVARKDEPRAVQKAALKVAKKVAKKVALSAVEMADSMAATMVRGKAEPMGAQWAVQKASQTVGWTAL